MLCVSAADQAGRVAIRAVAKEDSMNDRRFMGRSVLLLREFGAGRKKQPVRSS
jgi:hypothetical protein